MQYTQDQQCFTVSEVAADWNDLMILLRIMRPSIVRSASSRHTTVPINQSVLDFLSGLRGKYDY